MHTPGNGVRYKKTQQNYFKETCNVGSITKAARSFCIFYVQIYRLRKGDKAGFRN